MLYREMPKTGDKVSILGFGCMRFPIFDNDPSKINEAESIKMLHYAIDNGVNYLDTAYPYHGKGMMEPGQSEPFVAKALKNGYREKVKLATKLPSWLIEKREDMDRFLDEQLKRLETDHIDYYLIHSLNKELWENMKKFEVNDFLDTAIKSGKIKYAGFSFHDSSVELFKDIIDSYDWTFCQIQYNYLDEQYQAGREGLEYAASKKVGVIVMEPLKGGSLAVDLPHEAEAVLKKVKPGSTAAEWALRWLWDDPAVTNVLSGMSTFDQVKENVKIAETAKEHAFTEEEHNAIQKVKEIFSQKVKVNCTACGYCMPCPSGVDIPMNFKYYNDLFKYNAAGTKMNVRFMYARLLKEEQKASNCIACGKCETHCPQNINIIDELKQVKETFEQ